MSDIKPDKGKEGGSCNVTACQRPGAIWYNHGSYAWYCPACRQQIEFDQVNMVDWNMNHRPKLKHPMFETRLMIGEREQANGQVGA